MNTQAFGVAAGYLTIGVASSVCSGAVGGMLGFVYSKIMRSALTPTIKAYAIWNASEYFTLFLIKNCVKNFKAEKVLTLTVMVASHLIGIAILSSLRLIDINLVCAFTLLKTYGIVKLISQNSSHKIDI